MVCKNVIRVAGLFLFLFITGWSGQKAMSVAEVIQNAERLNGITIRIRGQAYLWVDPSQTAMWMSGGCVPKTDPSFRQGVVQGWLTLYDEIDPNDLVKYGAPYKRSGIKISTSVFHCSGDYCKLTCSPFEVILQRTYEFVGKLRMNDSELLLENIDLEQSAQLVDDQWMPITVGDFAVMFP